MINTHWLFITFISNINVHDLFLIIIIVNCPIDLLTAPISLNSLIFQSSQVKTRLIRIPRVSILMDVAVLPYLRGDVRRLIILIVAVHNCK